MVVRLIGCCGVEYTSAKGLVLKPGVPTLRDAGVDMTVNILDAMRRNIVDEVDDTTVAVIAIDETLDNFSVPAQYRSKIGDLLIKVSMYVTCFPHIDVTADNECPTDQSWLRMYRYYCQALDKGLRDRDSRLRDRE